MSEVDFSSIYPIGAVEQDGVVSLGCDETSDVQKLPAYAKYKNIKPGSTCYVVDTGDLYMLKSTGVWKKQ